MNNSKYFKEKFESIEDYRKIILFIFLIQNDKNFLEEIGFNKNDINRLNLEFKNILVEQHEIYSDDIKDQEESILEKFLNKWNNISILFLKLSNTNEALLC